MRAATVSDLMVDYDLTQDLEPLIAEVRTHYLSPRARSIIRCLQIAYQRYRDQAPSLPAPKEPVEV